MPTVVLPRIAVGNERSMPVDTTAPQWRGYFESPTIALNFGEASPIDIPQWVPQYSCNAPPTAPPNPTPARRPAAPHSAPRTRRPAPSRRRRPNKPRRRRFHRACDSCFVWVTLFCAISHRSTPRWRLAARHVPASAGQLSTPATTVQRYCRSLALVRARR